MLANAWWLLKQTFSDWSKHGAPRLGAALAYYSIFSLGPLLIIAIGVASLFFEGGGVQQQVIGQIRSLVGDQGAQAIEAMLAGSAKGNQPLIATVIGLVALLFGALSVVVQLKDALNIIWEVDSTPQSGVWAYIRTYALSLGAILGLGFLLTISLLSSALIAGMGQSFGSGLGEAGLHAANFVVNFVVLTLLFALMFKYLPDRTIAWGDVWLGGALTALLFNLGKFLIALYLGKQGLESTYGAASSIVLLLVWIYYSAQIVFFGAEFSQVYARRFGSLSNAVPHTDGLEADRVSANAGSLSFAVAAGMVLGALLARE
jgi:membrane protein